MQKPSSVDEKTLNTLFGTRYRPETHDYNYSTAGELTGRREQLRKLLRIPSTKDFPFKFADSFEPATINKNIPLYSRNPLTHQVARFTTDSSGAQIKHSTTFTDSGGLEFKARNGMYHRQKGVVQWADINAPSYSRRRPEVTNMMEKDPDIFKLKVSALSSPPKMR